MNAFFFRKKKHKQMTDKKILKYYVHTLCVGISYGVPTQGM